MPPKAELAGLLSRFDLPASVERWRVSLAPGTSRPTSGDEWTGAMVLVEQGSLKVACEAGGSRTFHAGDLLVLGLLPLRSLHNVGPDEVRLVGVRRHNHRPRSRFLRVIRRHRPGVCDEFHPRIQSDRA